jgi:hypothetical protein
MVGYRIEALDGKIGKIHDFLFDDARWTIRYVVVESRVFHDHTRVLISSYALGKPEWSDQALPVTHTMAEVQGLSEQGEVGSCRRELSAGEAARLNSFPIPCPPASFARPSVSGVCERPEVNSKLCSTDDVIGYRIRTTDGEFGHVYDFIVDDERWSIRNLAVATGNWLPGRKVLLAPESVAAVLPDAGEVAVTLSRHSLRNSPEYDPLEPVNRECQVRRFDYSGRPSEWE